MRAERRFTIDGDVRITGDAYEVTFPRAAGKRRLTSRFDFHDHPLRAVARKFVLADAEGIAAATIRGRCFAVKVLGEFMLSVGVDDLTPETYRELLHWLKAQRRPDGNHRFREYAIDHCANGTLAMYVVGLANGQAGWTQRSLDLMAECRARQRRGSRKRNLQRSVDAAVSIRTFNDLARAVAAEFEECECALAEYRSGRRAYLQAAGQGIERLDPNPFVVFALQSAMRLGLRACELNAMNPEDIHRDPDHGNHEVYVHAPNKSDAFIPVDDVFLRSLDLCHAWQEAARAGLVGAGTVWPDALLVYPTTAPIGLGTPVVLHTGLLSAVHLPYFFRKYFRKKIVDPDGSERPLLHAEGDSTKPFWISYAKIRNSFAIRLAERQRDPGVVQQVMRHQSFQTTGTYYLQSRKVDHAVKTAVALEGEARMLVLGLSRPLSVGINDETVAKAREAGALVPHGYCQSTLEGRGCVFPGNCLECKQLRVVESRLPRLVADRDLYVASAAELEEAGDPRGAENRRRLAARAQAYIYAVEESQTRRER